MPIGNISGQKRTLVVFSFNIKCTEKRITGKYIYIFLTLYKFIAKYTHFRTFLFHYAQLLFEAGSLILQVWHESIVRCKQNQALWETNRQSVLGPSPDHSSGIYAATTQHLPVICIKENHFFSKDIGSFSFRSHCVHNMNRLYL